MLEPTVVVLCEDSSMSWCPVGVAQTPTMQEDEYLAPALYKGLQECQRVLYKSLGCFSSLHESLYDICELGQLVTILQRMSPCVHVEK